MNFPLPLSEANLRRAMRDRRYSDHRHPQSAVWRDMVAKGWATLYPDELLRGDHTDPLERHLGDDGEIYASDGTRVGTAPGGRVQVRPYVRYVNGQPVRVSGYDRDAPEGATNAFQEGSLGDVEPSTPFQPHDAPPPKLTLRDAVAGGNSSQASDGQVAGGPGLKPKTEILTDTVPNDLKEADRDRVEPVDVPDRPLDPVEEGKRTAEQLGLRNPVKNHADAAAVQGVANFRFLDRDGQDRVMREVSNANDGLRGELQAKVADIKTQPAWVERSMTDAELRAGVESNERAARILEYGGAVPGAFGRGSSITSDVFLRSADRMRQELVRRGAMDDHH